MKPIDTVTGLPRSAEVSRLTAMQGRHGEIQGQGQAASFAREMKDRESTVNQANKTDKGAFDTDSGGGEAGSYQGNSGGRKKGASDKDSAGSSSPKKGAILDIRGT